MKKLFVNKLVTQNRSISRRGKTTNITQIFLSNLSLLAFPFPLKFNPNYWDNCGNAELCVLSINRLIEVPFAMIWFKWEKKMRNREWCESIFQAMICRMPENAMNSLNKGLRLLRVYQLNCNVLDARVGENESWITIGIIAVPKAQTVENLLMRISLIQLFSENEREISQRENIPTAAKLSGLDHRGRWIYFIQTVRSVFVDVTTCASGRC